ncbi:Aldehyde dehydrogenase, C-terminal [Phytophthora cactorum]|nr:Aldehyde dehydrogenase, C-terminal [Phytophthora cactorum]
MDLPLAHEVNLGPLIGPEAVEKASELVEDAVIHGAKVLTGGKSSDLGKNFYEATVLTIVNENMRIWREEIFGPVVPLFSFSRMCPVFSALPGELEAGMVAVNAGSRLSKPLWWYQGIPPANPHGP